MARELVAARELLPLSERPPLSTVALAAVWGVIYAAVAARSGRSLDWRDPWRPAVAAYRDLLTPREVGTFSRGLLSAVPLNVLLVTAAASAAAALAYARSGSTDRDNVFQLVFVLLAGAGIVRYVTWAKRFDERA